MSTSMRKQKAAADRALKLQTMAGTTKVKHIVVMKSPETTLISSMVQVKEFHLKLLESYLGSREAAEKALCRSRGVHFPSFLAYLSKSEAAVIALDARVVTVLEEPCIIPD